MSELSSASGSRPRGNRISVSLSDEHYAQLQLLSQTEGRSLSNLCARLLALALDQLKQSS